MTDRDDASIPTLTIRATPQHEPPVLTEVARPEDVSSEYGHARDVRSGHDQSPPPWDVTPQQRAWSAPAHAPAPAKATLPNPPGATGHTDVRGATSAPSDAVLRAALQADIEDAVQEALDEALHQVKARLEAELPDIVARAVRRTRLG